MEIVFLLSLSSSLSNSRILNQSKLVLLTLARLNTLPTTSEFIWTIFTNAKSKNYLKMSGIIMSQVLHSNEDLQRNDPTTPDVQRAMTFQEFDEYDDTFTPPAVGFEARFGEYVSHFNSVTTIPSNATPERLQDVIAMVDRVSRIAGGPRFADFDRSYVSVRGDRGLNLPGRVSFFRDEIRRLVRAAEAASRNRPVTVIHPVSDREPRHYISAPPSQRLVTEEDTEEICAICQEPSVLGSTVTVLPCEGHAGHWFHTECIGEWLATSSRQVCPYRCVQRPAGN